MDSQTRAKLIDARRKEFRLNQALREAQHELACGALSATVSTGAGSQSYTRQNMADIDAALMRSNARIKDLDARIAGRPSASVPRTVPVVFD